jgi:WD40 repeat protein
MYDTSSEPSPRIKCTCCHSKTFPLSSSPAYAVTALTYFDGHLETETVPPALLHALHHDKTSILSIAADGRYIYSGSQAHEIYVWDRKTLTLKASLSGHTGSVLALQTFEPKDWLFSASGKYSSNSRGANLNDIHR